MFIILWLRKVASGGGIAKQEAYNIPFKVLCVKQETQITTMSNSCATCVVGFSLLIQTLANIYILFLQNLEDGKLLLSQLLNYSEESLEEAL